VKETSQVQKRSTLSKRASFFDQQPETAAVMFLVLFPRIWWQQYLDTFAKARRIV
jgi:hypothetical protein